MSFSLMTNILSLYWILIFKFYVVEFIYVKTKLNKNVIFNGKESQPKVGMGFNYFLILSHFVSRRKLMTNEKLGIFFGLISFSTWEFGANCVMGIMCFTNSLSLHTTFSHVYALIVTSSHINLWVNFEDMSMDKRSDIYTFLLL